MQRTYYSREAILYRYVQAQVGTNKVDVIADRIEFSIRYYFGLYLNNDRLVMFWMSLGNASYEPGTRKVIGLDKLLLTFRI